MRISDWSSDVCSSDLGDEDGHAAFDEAVDVGPELAPGDRVDARCRLVEEQHRRLVHHRAGKRQPLLIAERQGAAVDREIALEMKNRRDALDRFALRLPVETIDARDRKSTRLNSSP